MNAEQANEYRELLNDKKGGVNQWRVQQEKKGGKGGK